jgi:uncharacterized protein (TIGR00369 family)
MSEALSSDVVAALDKLIVASPFGVLVGLRSEAVETDRVLLRLPFRSNVTTVGEMVHGGAIATLVDVAATAAAWASPRASLAARGSTVGFSLSFLAPALAEDLLADARVVQRGSTLTICEVAVAGASGQAVARALVTYRLSLPKAPGGGEQE